MGLIDSIRKRINPSEEELDKSYQEKQDKLKYLEKKQRNIKQESRIKELEKKTSIMGRVSERIKETSSTPIKSETGKKKTPGKKKSRKPIQAPEQGFLQFGGGGGGNLFGDTNQDFVNLFSEKKKKGKSDLF